MESLARRIAVALTHHPAPAVPFHEAMRLAHGTGMPINEGALLRSLRDAPDLFRVLEPWKSPGSDAFSEPWLVHLEPLESTRAGPSSLRRLRTCLVWLGRSLDDRSTMAMARWFSLLREEERVRRAP